MGPDQETHLGMLTGCRYSVGHAEMCVLAEIPLTRRANSHTRETCPLGGSVAVVDMWGGFQQHSVTCSHNIQDFAPCYHRTRCSFTDTQVQTPPLVEWWLPHFITL